jgi:hypothetical protein
MSFTRAEITRRYRLSHLEQTKEKSRKYYQDNKAHCNDVRARYRISHPKKMVEYVKNYADKNPMKSFYWHLKADAKTRKKEFTLTFDEYVVFRNQPCFYCQSTNSGRGGGLDRLNNEKGYIKDNVVSCCGNCNRVRCDVLSVEEMQTAVTAILALRASRGNVSNGL